MHLVTTDLKIPVPKTKHIHTLALHFLSAGFPYGSHRCGGYGEGDQGDGSKLQQERLVPGEVWSTTILPIGWQLNREPDAADSLGLQRLTLSGKLCLPSLRQLLAFLSVRALINKTAEQVLERLVGGGDL